MRGRAFGVAGLALALASCGSSGSSPPTCELPVGCVSVDAACRCTQREVVSVEDVPVKFVVVSIWYAPVGAESTVRYQACEDPSCVPAPAQIGSRWRTTVQRAGQPRRVAALGELDATGDEYVDLATYRVTAASGALMWGAGQWLGLNATVDVPARDGDVIEVWVNPVLTLTTYHGGELGVDWGWSPSCPGRTCTGAATLWLTAAELQPGATSADPVKAAFLDALTADERAALLRFHPLFDPPGRDPATLAADPRFLEVADGWAVTRWPAMSGLPSWLPCDGVLTDAEFPALARSEVPIAGGTIEIEYLVQATAPSCAERWVQLWNSTSTDCFMTADSWVDRAFGTILQVPRSVGERCTSR